MNIIIVDAHPVIRRGLSDVLSPETGYELVGEAGSVADALDMISKLKPDMAILELKLRKEDGLNVVKLSKERGISCKFIVLTQSKEKIDVNRAEEVDVDGYILKEAHPDEILHALDLISRGNRYYDPGIVG